MTCLGLDGLVHTVSAALNLGTGTTCDVNGDGQIDVDDIGLIDAARNQLASPGDVRDADGDSRVTVLDSRMCTLKCTNALCVP